MTAHCADNTHPRAIAVVMLIALVMVVGCEGSAPMHSPAAPTHGTVGMPGPTAVSLPFLSGSGGGVIAFVSERTGNYEIYAMNADGSSPLRLTKNPAHDGYPKWSPDGTQIAFASNRTGNWDIYVMNVSEALLGVGDSSLQRLTENAGDNLAPAWSPDSTQMAFVSTRDGNHEIYVMSVPGGTDIDGAEQGSGDPRRLTTDDAEDWCPAWSPDGARIAFYSERDGNQEIYVVSVPDGTDADGAEQGSGDLQRLTHDDADDFHPAWSPAGGTQIAFISNRNGGRDGSGHVYVMAVPDGTDVDGAEQGSGDPRRLTNTRVGDESPTWSPGGTRIAFASEHDGDGEIYIVDVQEALRSGGADLGDLQQLTFNHVGDYCPDWRPMSH